MANSGKVQSYSICVHWCPFVSNIVKQIPEVGLKQMLSQIEIKQFFFLFFFFSNLVIIWSEAAEDKLNC